MIDPILITKVWTGLRGARALPSVLVADSEALEAALSWIEAAWQASRQRGVSKGYDLLRGNWAPPYPETTGYTIPTLLNAAALLQRPVLQRLALTLADFLLERATSDGAVVHWQAGQGGEPVIFDTGQVLFGWVAAYRFSQDGRYLESAARAGRWRAQNQSEGGSWKKFQHLGVEKVIDTRVAWSLLELDAIQPDDILRSAARKNLDWACSMQQPDGWFERCSFWEGSDPYTHTLAYTAEGLYESGTRLQEPRYLGAGRLAAEAMLQRQRPDGSLAGTYGPGWSRPASWSCLTGNVQMSRLWLLLYRDTGEERFKVAARRALDFVKRCQDLTTANVGVRGGISGSFPVYGGYERLKYPNWAAKFFADAILAFSALEGQPSAQHYHG